MALVLDGFRSLSRNLPALLLSIALVYLASLAFYGSQAQVMQRLDPLASAPTEKGDEKSEMRAGDADKGEQAKKAEGSAATKNTSELTVSATSDGSDPDAMPNWARAFSIVSEALFAAALSAIYAVVLAMLGAAIDRPLWKCNVPGEALRRFFVPWFIVTLAPMVMRNFQAQLDSADAKVASELVLILIGTLVIPAGACIMFHGALEWHELGIALGVMGRQFRLFIPVLLVSIAQYIVQVMADEYLPRGHHEYTAFAWGASGLNMLMVVFDLLAFCMMWRICMLDRDSAHQRINDRMDD